MSLTNATMRTYTIRNIIKLQIILESSIDCFRKMPSPLLCKTRISLSMVNIIIDELLHILWDQVYLFLLLCSPSHSHQQSYGTDQGLLNMLCLGGRPNGMLVDNVFLQIVHPGPLQIKRRPMIIAIVNCLGGLAQRWCVVAGTSHMELNLMNKNRMKWMN